MRTLRHPPNNRRIIQEYNFFFREVPEFSDLPWSSGTLFKLFNGTLDKTEPKLMSLGSDWLRMAALVVLLLLSLLLGVLVVDIVNRRLVKLIKLTDTLLWAQC